MDDRTTIQRTCELNLGKPASQTARWNATVFGNNHTCPIELSLATRNRIINAHGGEEPAEGLKTKVRERPQERATSFLASKKIQQQSQFARKT